MNKVFLLFCFFSLSLFGCKTSKSIFGGHIKNTTVEALDKEVEARRPVFKTFSGKAKVDVTGKDMSQSASATIDIKRDSAIGISLRVMGVEGVRILVTPDSVKILDRLNQKYIPRPISYLDSIFALDITFLDLQHLITGEPLFYEAAKVSMGISDDKYVLIAEKGVYKNTVWLSPEFDIMRMFIEDLLHTRTVTLAFDDYQKIQGRSFAFKRTLLIKAQDELSANIEFSKISFDEPFAFTFSVNPKYERIDE